MGSTSSVAARDNTCTTGTGVPIHWLNGNKVADNYGDFYDGDWDDNNPRNQHGNLTIPVSVPVWTGSASDGTISSNSNYLGSGTTAATTGKPGENGKELDNSTASLFSSLRFYGLSQVFKVPTANEAPRATAITIPGSRAPASGDTYREGETIRMEVTVSEPAAVGGRPFLGLSIQKADGTEGEYEAAYVSGGSSTADDPLIFDFVAPPGLKDDDGIQVHSTALRLNGARIVASSDGYPVSWAIEAEHNILHADGTSVKVDSSRLQPLTGGVCDRTPAVRNGIVAALSKSGVELCSQVTAAHLAGMTTLSVERPDLAQAVGDFAGLSGLQDLTISAAAASRRYRWVCSTGWPAWRSCISRWG